MEEEFIDTYKAAEQLNMSRATLWRLLRERDIDRFKVPGDRRSLIRVSDMESLKKPVPIPRHGAEDAKKAAA